MRPRFTNSLSGTSYRAEQEASSGLVPQSVQLAALGQTGCKGTGFVPWESANVLRSSDLHDRVRAGK
ncbi:hypothetical protein SBA5_1080015 [Candidatus Sulfotelmatomonas gaucii]|uniref:Uncharacterized protein n=1 Tax=Candidatus Sulfuritelmatomonas gaucii TaxID=2043161 RepID=A0A2N9L2T4_9BACT|nr:hypothetical protein SBA5_1080015 [Candidatus Sulfotelmatomonas gaucii]